MMRILSRIKNFFLGIKNVIHRFLDIFMYVILITTYAIYMGVKKISSELKFLNSLKNLLLKLINRIDRPKKGNISRV